MKTKMSKDREDKAGIPRLGLFVLLVLGALVLGDLNQRMADARHLEQEATSLTEQLEVLNEDILRLEDEIDQANTDEYIETWAHEDAIWVREGEIIVITVADDVEQPNLEITEDMDLPVMSNLEIWMEVLFGQ